MQNAEYIGVLNLLKFLPNFKIKIASYDPILNEAIHFIS
jgi:hypothetical protein